MTDTNDPYRTIGDSSDGESAVELKPGMVLNSKYELIEQIGRGGMGVVWKARDIVGDRLVALKFVPRDLQRFESEMQRVRDMFGKVHALNHQSICPLYNLEDGGTQIGHYLVMKYLEGETLSEFVTRFDPQRKGLPFNKVAALLSRVAKALDYAHRYDVIHRDIKPSNIFLVKAGNRYEVQIIDFGLAAEVRSSMLRVSQQTQYDTAGTYPYMAPEQFRGRRQTAATDQYALAVVAYELLAGHLPFEGDFKILKEAVLNDKPETIRTIPNDANATLMKALAKDAVDRFGNCEAFVKAMGTPSPFAPEPPVEEEEDEEEDTDDKPRSSMLPSVVISVAFSLCLIRL